MSDFFGGLGGDLVPVVGILAGIVAIVGGFVVAIIHAITGHRRRMQLDEMEATLKLEMIERGMSADDIKQVLEAGMAAHHAPDTAGVEEVRRARPARPKPFGCC